MVSLSLLLLSLGWIASSAAVFEPKVRLGRCTLVGDDIKGLKQEFFGGIPYAEPPVGKLRLKPPVLKTRLEAQSFDARFFGPACLQDGLPLDSVSENCLTINIFRPAGLAPEAGLPVLFWVYGGGFDSGASSIYNGSGIVAQSVARGTPVIYVNFNYRLGPLGFPQGQEGKNIDLVSRGKFQSIPSANDKKALNLAMKDQLTALQWVQENIGLFGGDKNKVTVFGQSAGAIMTSILLLNSPIAQYARAAILQSGSPSTALTFNAARRETEWQKFVTAVPSCTITAKSGRTFDCLQKANSSDILKGVLSARSNAGELFPYDPTLDGPDGLFPELPSQFYARGKFARIPTIAGTTLDEGTIFTPRTIGTESQIRDYIIANYSPPAVTVQTLAKTADELLRLYPNDPAQGSPFNTGSETFGLSPVYKQTAALREASPLSSFSLF
ncbi:hypothetical protein H0H81_009591 [Sphagnurus paluster]|uniref:Carboxylic ester hydrolase n=1 Tax=Sphagnurus paluster TaxID=117069 RepID=A0A9P7FPB8_9AGAR|nr:hypothetical protein H0H81_009591 [Sphagnurus paluster]